MFYLTTRSTHFIYGYMVSDMIKDHSARNETYYHHMGYSFRLAAKVLLYASSQDKIVHTTALVTDWTVKLIWVLACTNIRTQYLPVYYR